VEDGLGVVEAPGVTVGADKALFTAAKAFTAPNTVALFPPTLGAS